MKMKIRKLKKIYFFASLTSFVTFLSLLSTWMFISYYVFACKYVYVVFTSEVNDFTVIYSQNNENEKYITITSVFGTYVHICD